MSNKVERMRENAENCADLAKKAVRPADKARYGRMEQAWQNLAETQEWLEGKTEEAAPVGPSSVVDASADQS